MSVVSSRPYVVQGTFGTTVSIVDSVSQMSNEEAMCECHEQKANSDANLSHSCVFVFKTHDVTTFVIDRDSRKNSLPQLTRG